MYRFNTGAEAGQSGGAALTTVPVHGSSRRYRLSTVVPDATPNTSGDASEEVFPATLDQITLKAAVGAEFSFRLRAASIPGCVSLVSDAEERARDGL
jgi:hypothetical protein